MSMSLRANRCLQGMLRRPAAAVLLALLSMPAQLGAVELRVQLTGASSPSELGDAVVSLHQVGGAPPAGPGRTAVVDQRASSFVPRVLPVQAGTEVSFVNSDRIRHQVYSFSKAKTFELPLYAGSDAAPVDFDQPGIVVVGCNIHDSMIGYVVVLDTPHFGRAADEGRVVLDAPAGTYRMQVWHPRIKGPALQKTVVLQPGQSQRIEVALEIPAAAQQGRGPQRLRALRDKLREMPRKP